MNIKMDLQYQCYTNGSIVNLHDSFRKQFGVEPRKMSISFDPVILFLDIYPKITSQNMKKSYIRSCLLQLNI